MYGDFFVLFTMIFTGYFLRKINVINDEMNSGLNKFILYFAYPCLLVYNIGTMDMTGALVVQYLLALSISLVLYFIHAGYSYFFTKNRKYPKRVANVAELSITAPNNGFMGFPIALIFFGDIGLFMMMGNNAAMNIFYFSYGLHAMRRNNADREKMSLKTIGMIVFKVLINPNIVALVLGFVICFTGLSLDNSVGVYLKTIGQVATPMAMIFIGSTLAGSKFFDMFKNRIVWGSAINKLVVIPLMTLALCYFLPVSPVMKACFVLSAAMPAAATTSMLAEQENLNTEIASKILFFTTVVSMGTIPVAIWVIEKAFGI
ncbi:MAG: AEC family transporter [Anaerovoracaceae bacterium]